MKQRLFISGVQRVFAEERRTVHDFVRADPLLGRFFDAFLFEDLPASDRRADDVYLGEVGLCAAYVGFLGVNTAEKMAMDSRRPNANSTKPRLWASPASGHDTWNLHRRPRIAGMPVVRHQGQGGDSVSKR